MNNNQDKITVLSSQKPLLPKPVIILLVLAGLAIILLAGYFYFQKGFFKKEVLPSPTPDPQALNQTVEGVIISYNKQAVTLQKQDNSEASFNIYPATVFYKCTDFSDINSCTIEKGIKKGFPAKVYAKGTFALYIQYK